METGIENFFGYKIDPDNMNALTYLYESDYSGEEPVGPHH